MDSLNDLLWNDEDFNPGQEDDENDPNTMATPCLSAHSCDVVLSGGCPPPPPPVSFLNKSCPG